ncbi:MAG TPA: hypothetical protein VHG27_01625 [Xanthobacteraceae bacterium]|nr:hypothetical protein [Xanthobacteraceae bacterium]
MGSVSKFNFWVCAALLAAPLLTTACSPLMKMQLALAGSGPHSAMPPPAGPDGTPIDPTDDLALGQQHFAAANYGLAEQHFRRAVEKSTGPGARDAEAWLGLAASYDRLRRFDLADRAYAQALRAVGPTPEVLNNQGYSFMLRRDYATARAKLALAHEKDPGNPYILNNLALLDGADPRRAR